MELKEIKDLLNVLAKDIEEIQDKKTAAIQNTLLNLVEYLIAQNEEQQKEIQRLKDEINRLKGEQGKPKFGDRKPRRDVSSKRNLQKKKKNKSELPDDAVFKGYQETVVQDIVVKTDNINFKKEVYYSASQKKTFIGKVPAGYEGEFGPGIKSHILNLSHDPLITQ
jgi:hypothetical protein